MDQDGTYPGCEFGLKNRSTPPKCGPSQKGAVLGWWYQEPLPSNVMVVSRASVV